MTSAIGPRSCSPPWQRPTLAARTAGHPGGAMPAGSARLGGACPVGTVIRLPGPIANLAHSVRHRPRIGARPRHAFRQVSRDRFFTILIIRAWPG